MSVSKSMLRRIDRVNALARKKKIAELERLASDDLRPKALPQSGDDGHGPKAKGSAADSYSRKKNQPKPKGNRSDAKLDRTVDSGGYPAKGYMPQGLGKGSDSEDSEQTEQQALDDATDTLLSLTSHMPELAPTPKPKLRGAGVKVASLLTTLRNENFKLDMAITSGDRKKVRVASRRVKKCVASYTRNVKKSADHIMGLRSRVTASATRSVIQEAKVNASDLRSEVSRARKLLSA